MTEAETNRIATLTTGAVKTTAEAAIKAMLAAVEAAEEKTREMRAAVEARIKAFEEDTDSLSENVTMHVSSCQAIIDSFQAHHLKILNVEPPESKTAEEVRARVMPTVVRNIDNEVQQLRAVADAIDNVGR